MTHKQYPVMESDSSEWATAVVEREAYTPEDIRARFDTFAYKKVTQWN